MVASYATWVIGGMGSGWQWLKNVSIFSAYQPQRALETGTADLAPLLILFGIALISAAGALAVFQRRDAIA